MFSALSLNLATFLVRPVLQNILGLTDEAMDGFLEHRKEENENHPAKPQAVKHRKTFTSLMHKFSKTMKIIRSILLLYVGFGTLPAQAQLTIDACQQKAQANYPLVAQYGLIRQSEQYDLKKRQQRLPASVVAVGQSLLPDRRDENPVLVAGHRHPDPQQRPVSGRSRGEPGNLGRRTSVPKKQNVKASAEVDLQQQQVDMYAIRERVNSLFFGILLTEEQLN